MKYLERWTDVLIVCTAMLSGALILLPGISGPYVLDDWYNLLNNPDFTPDTWNWHTILQAVFNNDSPTGRPVSMLSFVGNVMWTGLEPWPMKLTSVLLHGLMAGIVYFFTRQVLLLLAPGIAARDRIVFSALVCIAFAVHPLAITSTLYVIQRMNLLASLFTLAALFSYLQARLQATRCSQIKWLGITTLLGLLGIFSKENAVLLPIYVLLIEWLARTTNAPRPPDARFHRLLLAGAVLGSLLFVLALIIGWNGLTTGYAQRDFTLLQRLLSEPYVLLNYAGMALAPNHLILGLFLDDLPVATGLFSPPQIMLGILFLLAMVVAIWATRKRMPLVAFGLGFFLIGHLLEGTVLPLELAFEHRTYLPAIGLLIAAGELWRRFAARLEMKSLGVTGAAAFILYLAFFTLIRAVHWGDAYLLAQLESQHHPLSARAQSFAGMQHIEIARRYTAEGNQAWRNFHFDAATTYFRLASDRSRQPAPHLINELQLSVETGLKFPTDRYRRLLEELRNKPVPPSIPQALNAVVLCETTPGCEIEPALVEDLLRATLDNPTLADRPRAEVLVAAASHFNGIRNDAGLALAMLAMAAEEYPVEPRFQEFLVQQLIVMERWEDATLELEELAARDNLGVYRERIEILERHIRQKDRNLDIHAPSVPSANPLPTPE